MWSILEIVPYALEKKNCILLFLDELSHIYQLGLSHSGDGKGGLACCNSWGYKESNTTEWLNWAELNIHPVQFSSVAQSCPTLCNPMYCRMRGLPVHHQLPEFTHTHVHRVSDAIQPSHPLSSPSSPAFSPSHDQGLFQWVNSSHEVAKSTGVSASTSDLLVNTQGWSPLGLTGWISLQSKGLSRVFSSTTVQKHQFFCTQLSLQDILVVCFFFFPFITLRVSCHSLWTCRGSAKD